MKALVTGGAGFIGSHLSERLLDAGAEVIALDCFTDYYPRAIKEANVAACAAAPGYRLVEAAIADADLPALLDGVTHVFHLAAQAGVRKSWGRDFRVYTELNVDATQILLEACVGRPIERVVYASSSSVYGDLVDDADARGRPAAAGVAVRRDQAVGRAALLPLLRQPRGADGVAALLHRLRSAAAARHGLPPVLQRPGRRAAAGRSSATACRPATSPSSADAAAATATAAVRGVPGRVYNIGGGSRVTLREVFDLLGRVTGRPVTVDVQPAQKGDMRDTYADTTRARADLGFAPSVTLEEGLAAMYRWFSTR